jgi:hypothetical protein
MSVDVGRSSSIPTTKPTKPIPAKSSAVKTDKPRPHVCATCTRSFARLEHLKRHERSHTKEKPFQCPVCERCFARRDLLLRHKQKLHASFPSDSPRTSRNASASSSSNKRKSSTPANAVTPSGSQSQLTPSGYSSSDSGTPITTAPYSHLLRSQLGTSMTRPRPASFSASSASSYSKLKDIEALNATLYPCAPSEVEFSTPQLMPASLDNMDIPTDDLFNVADPLFINPQQLTQSNQQHHQISHSGQQQQSGQSNGQQQQQQTHDNESPQNNNFFSYNMFMNQNRSRQADDDLSPSSVLNMDHDDFSWLPPSSNDGYRASPQTILNATSFSPPPHALSDSPLSLVNNGHSSSEAGENPPTVSTTMSPPTTEDLFGVAGGGLNGDMRDHKAFSSHIDGLDNDSARDTHFWTGAHQSDFNQQQMDTGSQQPAPLSSPPGHLITPQLRLHILATLSTPTPFSSSQPPQLPSTLELQRYINSYTENFGKHLPFLHHTLEFTPDNVPLVLGMAAIGALYTFEHTSSANIFEISRSCIHVYLESRRERKTDQQTTPLWLVQALILGVIYGLFSSEPLANEIAVAQANAVVSLAKSAGLHLPPSKFVTSPDHDRVDWRYFVTVQERIRTMHVVHMISCLLSTSYNVMSTLKNDDIKCGSPCDESLWTARSGAEWLDIMHRKELDRSPKKAYEGPIFNDCLFQLLQGNTLMGKIPQFTLLSLMYAVHLEIHERRLSHGRNTTYASPPSTGPSPPSPADDLSWLEQQKANVESVLRAWETTWSLCPLASLSPSSQYGPLMSDAIPLSSLAHVRVYVDLRRVKEAFWKRDFVLMNQELDSLSVPPYFDGTKKFDGLLEAASYAADAISLWEKHSVKWTLETTAGQTFIHTLVSLFDCGLAVSEFLHRLELRPKSEWTDDESLLVTRVGKIFFRVLEVVGHDGLKDGDDRPLNEDGTLRSPGKLSVLALLVVSKILCKTYIWPFALVMGEALQSRSQHIWGI